MPAEDEIRRLVGDWIAKADLDFAMDVRLVARSGSGISSRSAL